MQSPSGEQILSIRTEEVEDVTGLPVIVSNVTIFSDLTFKAHSSGALVPYQTCSCPQAFLLLIAICGKV